MPHDDLGPRRARGAQPRHRAPGPWRAEGRLLTATVLVVDDDRALRQVTRVALTRLGCRVLTAADGEEALLLARVHEPAVVLSDVHMPRLDGRGLLEALRREPRLAATPVVLMSAAEDVAPAGAFAFLRKPFGLAELERVVSEALAAASRRAAA